jgi:hypothetical protein
MRWGEYIGGEEKRRGMGRGGEGEMYDMRRDETELFEEAFISLDWDEICTMVSS